MSDPAGSEGGQTTAVAAVPLLSKLENAVDALLKQHKNGGPVKEGNSNLLQVCRLVEEVFLHNTKKRMYWNYISDCLENRDIIKMVLKESQNKTTVGKGRAFIRINLKTKTLAEHVQVAVQNVYVTKQYYHRDAVLRDPQHQQTLIDILYNLNVVDFELDSKLSLDENWPIFAEKNFSQKPRLQTKKASLDALSMTSEKSIEHSERSIDYMKEKIIKLTAQRDEARKDRETALLEKQEADLVWNELSAKHKEEAFLATEERIKAQELLRPTQDKCEALQAANETLEKSLAVYKSALMTMGDSVGAVKTEVEKTPSELVTHIIAALRARVDTEVEERKEAQCEAEKIRNEMSRVRQDSAAEVKALKREVAVLNKTLEEGQERLRQELESYNVTINDRETEIQEWKTKHESVLAEKEDMDKEAKTCQARLQENLKITQAKIIECEEHITSLEETLQTERQQREAEQKDLNLLRTAIGKLTSDKVDLWTQVNELQTLSVQTAEAVTGVWQPDETVKDCNQCHKVFTTFSNRKHHCRNCGRIFCASCTSRTARLSGSSKAERVCDSCHGLLRTLQSETPTRRESQNSQFSKLAGK
eukprot:m.17506 g.17506  ORF g.17506 m.17506 type:complete len:591 (-) comp6039_c0_seq1:80-1852(-)